ncbi:DUF6716 putative glycosyltransferase [Microbacterium kyungheense]|uniref:Glycosyltransferase involved in cell wall biosynthesis n=1 Tax=Microbacterium kyungheense TaxID=1263636 RepID=A0A543FM91_9MICO|nr:DUF6716 putative glycosyltransferase [Microbacterium kyungheense]TQM34970.1 hypothetical protein FB391_1266 [Microbacterium kyungheense]
MTEANGRAPRIVAIADTDSYVKWAAALLGAEGGGVDAALLVLETPLVVSDTQLSAALAGSGLGRARVERVAYAGLRERLEQLRPDAVLLGARGPLVRVLAREIAGLDPRPVLVTGLPGISIPATRKAVVYRLQCDLFVVHSRREVREFGALSARTGYTHRYALATLPFARGASSAAAASTPRGTDLLFATQAKVPAGREDRLRIARMLAAAAEADPARRVVVKLRAAAGEHQTHAEQDGYPELLATLGPLPANLVTSTEPMGRALDRAEGLVTVSSTAAIEAIARGIPVIALDTFGVSARLINETLADADLLAGEDDVIARRFRHPDPEWLDENYFHPPSDDDWIDAVTRLVARRTEGTLPPRAPLARRGGALRDAWERRVALGRSDTSAAGSIAWVIGVPARAAVRFTSRARRALWSGTGAGTGAIANTTAGRREEAGDLVRGDADRRLRAGR